MTRYPIVDMSSPIGAMVYTRFPQAGEANPIVRVGVVPAEGGDTKWMDTGADTDVYLPRVVWRRIAAAWPSSDSIARRTDSTCSSRTPPLAPPRSILTDSDKYWINLGDDLYFFSDNKRFLWTSERTGFRHYYLYDISGKQLDQLTSGDWGIIGNGGFGPGAESHPAVDEARGFIYFLSNKDDVRGTQLYRLSLQDKTVTRITREDGAHAFIAPDASAFVDAYSNAMTPPRQDLYRIDGKRTAVIDENKVSELAEYHLSPVEFLDLRRAMARNLCASIIMPPDFDASRKYPVLVYVYGGPQVQNVRDEWGGADFWDGNDGRERLHHFQSR